MTKVLATGSVRVRFGRSVKVQLGLDLTRVKFS